MPTPALLKALCLACLFLTTKLIAGLNHPELGEIKDEFWVTWNGSRYEGKLTLAYQNNIKFTITLPGSASSPRVFTLHPNLIESLSLYLKGDTRKKYINYIVALISATFILPKYQYSPDLTQPSCAQISDNEQGLAVSLSALSLASENVYPSILIQQNEEYNFNVTINGLTVNGHSETVSVQFPSPWAGTLDKEVKFTWFDEPPGNKKWYFPFKSK